MTSLAESPALVHDPHLLNRSPPSATVLIVDDNAGKRLALRATLASLGHAIVEADSGVAALRCVLRQDFAVILLDVRMPEMDGLETAALIRKRQQSEMTPIIFITAYGRDEIANVDGYAEGAVDFIFAPVSAHDLRAKVTVFANLFIKAELLARQARQVQASEVELRMLTDAAPIGIFQTDARQQYVYTNPRWSEITGVSAADALGRGWHDIGAVDLGAAPSMNVHGLTDSEHRFQIRRPDDAVRVVVLSSRPMPAIDGVINGMVGTLADVTAEVAAATALSQARDAAVAASTMQRDFTASASHELRTPTTAILGFVEEVLDNDALSGEDRSFLAIVHRNAQRLSRLIDDLLVLGQVEIGPSMMHLEPTELGPLVDRVVHDFAATAQSTGIALLSDLQPEMVPRCLADPLRLEQAFSNLLSNALKFTPAGGTVVVELKRSASGDIEISVADTGPGLSAAEMKRIFERFYRSEGAVDSLVRGSGLGLAIARAMVEAQNGTLRVESEVGHGSTFTIALPALSAEVS